MLQSLPGERSFPVQENLLHQMLNKPTHEKKVSCIMIMMQIAVAIAIGMPISFVESASKLI